LGAHRLTGSGLTVMIGASVSTTHTWCPQLAPWPMESLAEHVLVLHPSEKKLPEGGWHDTL
jgi:hypothetical protein